MKPNHSYFRPVGLLMALAMTVWGISSCTTDDVEAETEGESNVVSFDFTSATELAAWGVAVPANGTGTNISTLSKLSATITATNAEGANPIRVWATNSGVLDLRIYKGDALTFSVPEGYVITQLSWTSANTDNIDSWTANAGSISGGQWTAPAGKTYSSVTFTATATTRINVLTFGYETGAANAVAGTEQDPDPAPDPQPDPEPQPEKPVTVSLDFTSASFLTAQGIAIPANGAGTPLTAAVTKEQFCMTATNAEGANPIRVWATNSGVLDLRSYTGDAVTYSVPADYYITALSWTSANAANIDAWTPSSGTLSDGVWTTPAGEKLSSITFTATATTRINVVTATYEKRAE
ncbi:MAG: hypothetical protein IJ551_00045 [Prevotella sp.]|nr:hypothetical protein [Prevotella sp.]